MELKLRNMLLTIFVWTFSLLFLVFSFLASKHIENIKIARLALIFLLFTWIIQNVYWYETINYIITTHTTS